MLEALFAICVIGTIALLWLDGARAREMAIGIAQSICQRNDVQMLDGTVAMRRMGLRWGTSGIRIRRMFSFDFSKDGAERRFGYVIMLGKELEQYGLDE